jgi:hypothetical protein
MKSRSSFVLGLGCAALLALFAPAALHADSQLIVNGGFENGTYTSTVGGNTNAFVPVGWTANAGFDLNPAFNRVNTGNQFDGNYLLSISNFDYQPLATLSQTFSDVSGDTYSGSFWAYDGGANGDPNAYLSLLIDNNALVTLGDTIGSWTQYTFTFTGTGSDTLTLAAQTNPSEWFVDDVSVTGQATSVTPEPSSLLLLATGLAGLAGAMRRKFSR